MTRRPVALTAVGIGLVSVGCTNGADTGGPAPPGTAASPTAVVTDCVTGQWRG